jgi:hypothetical protein
MTTPRPYNDMTLGEIRTELVKTFADMLNRENDESFNNTNTKDDFDDLVEAAAAVIDLENALHHQRYGDVDFNPNGTPHEPIITVPVESMETLKR